MSYHVLNFDQDNREYRINEDTETRTPRCLKYAIEPVIPHVVTQQPEKQINNTRTTPYLDQHEDKPAYIPPTYYTQPVNFDYKGNNDDYTRQVIRIEMGKETVYYVIIAFLLLLVLLLFIRLLMKTKPRNRWYY